MKEIEAVLYMDPQAVKPVGFCPVCARELYPPTLTCLHCERSTP